MNMVPYSPEVFNKYSDGDTFKVKLRCGQIQTANRYDTCLFVEAFEYFKASGCYLSSKHTFIDIVEIEDKPKKLVIGKTYNCSSKSTTYTVVSYDSLSNLYICKNNQISVYQLIQENGVSQMGTYRLDLKTERD